MPVNFQVRHAVIIPDVHQDIAWVERILTQETEADLFVFLGDYFDSRLPPAQRAGVAATCEYLTELHTRLGERAVFLLGNHDIQYLEARRDCLNHRVPRYLRYQCGSAFRAAAAAKIAKSLPTLFWSEARLFACVNGILLSHAGVHASLWPQRESLTDSLVDLQSECETALLDINRVSHPLLRAGLVRGGDAEFGGITWQDWDQEFHDSLPLPQIVGHTGKSIGARQIDRSWCIDGQQTSYARLDETGMHNRVA